MSEKSGRATDSIAAILISIYMFALSIITLCPSLAVIGCGGFLGGLGTSFNSFGAAARSPGTATAGTAVDILGGIIGLLGLLGLILTVALVVVGIGLLQTKPWAYMGAIVLNATYIGLQLIGAAVGGGLSTLQIIFIVLSGAAIFFLVSNQDLKESFGRG